MLCQSVVNLRMPWDGLPLPSCGIDEDVVIRAGSEERTPVLLELTDELPSLHIAIVFTW